MLLVSIEGHFPAVHIMLPYYFLRPSFLHPLKNSVSSCSDSPVSFHVTFLRLHPSFFLLNGLSSNLTHLSLGVLSCSEPTILISLLSRQRSMVMKVPSWFLCKLRVSPHSMFNEFVYFSLLSKHKTRLIKSPVYLPIYVSVCM
jgi:hypothetical protein